MILDRKCNFCRGPALDKARVLTFITRHFEVTKFPVKARLSHRFAYGLIICLAAMLRWLPDRLRAATGGTLGQLIYFIGIRRVLAGQNLRAAFPGMPDKAVQTVLKRTYRHFGRVAAEFAFLPRLLKVGSASRIIVEHYETLENALAGGKGCIVFSGHLGNWEVMGAAAALHGIPVSFVVTTQRNKLVEYWIDKYRRLCGIEIIKRREAIRGISSALKRNRAVAILIDQDAHEDGAFVPFFGRLASTPRGAAIFHLRTGAPLIFAQSTWLPGNRFKIRFVPLLTDGSEDADALTARMTAQLEAAIRETPEQWTWFHKRWKTRPPESS